MHNFQHTDWRSLLKALLPNGLGSDPRAFSRFLVDLVPHFAAQENMFDEAVKSRAAYQRVLTDYLAICHPEGVFAARGLHGIPIEDLDTLMSLIFSWEDLYPGMSSEENWSESIVYAANRFATPSKRSFPKTGVLLIASVPHEKVRSFGGDSESGPYMEAELKIDRCPECIEAVYAISPNRVGKQVSDKERRYFGLSHYMEVTIQVDDFYEPGVILHSDTDLGPIRDRVIRGRRVTQPPRGLAWWKLG